MDRIGSMSEHIRRTFAVTHPTTNVFEGRATEVHWAVFAWCLTSKSLFSRSHLVCSPNSRGNWLFQAHTLGLVKWSKNCFKIRRLWQRGSVRNGRKSPNIEPKVWADETSVKRIQNFANSQKSLQELLRSRSAVANELGNARISKCFGIQSLEALFLWFLIFKKLFLI